MTSVLARLLPTRIDNDYRGARFAVWLFATLVFVKFAMGANGELNTRHVATSADGIPLDSYPTDAVQTVISMFALLGVSQLTLALLGVLVLIRYRAMLPLMYLLLLIEHVAKRAVLFLHPIARSEGAPIGLYINMAILALLLVGLVLSLTQRKAAPPGSQS